MCTYPGFSAVCTHNTAKPPPTNAAEAFIPLQKDQGASLFIPIATSLAFFLGFVKESLYSADKCGKWPTS